MYNTSILFIPPFTLNFDALAAEKAWLCVKKASLYIHAYKKELPNGLIIFLYCLFYLF